MRCVSVDVYVERFKYRVYMLEEGGTWFYLVLRHLRGNVGISLCTNSAMASAARARESNDPEYAHCLAIEDNMLYKTGSDKGIGYRNATPYTTKHVHRVYTTSYSSIRA